MFGGSGGGGGEGKGGRGGGGMVVEGGAGPRGRDVMEKVKVAGLFLHSTVLTVLATFLRSMCFCYNVLPTLINMQLKVHSYIT